MKLNKSFLLLIPIILIVAASGFFLCCKTTVKYKAYTGIVKCDIAIMTAIIKSKPGYEAFEIAGFVNECFSGIDRNDCKKEHFGAEPNTYDKKDVRYIDYLSCLADKKQK